MKTLLVVLFTALMTVTLLANIAPVPVVVSATMRPGTTLMDVVFRVNDPDDAIVKVRALAFIDGARSFAKVIKPTAFVEGTGVKLGEAIATNTAHTLTWDVAADWNIDLGQLKFEILCLDQRGLLAFDWITIPAASGQPALTISKDTPAAAKVLDALFWEYAGSNSWVTLSSGELSGNAQSGVFAGVSLASGTTLQSYAPAFLFKRMGLAPASAAEVSYASIDARAGLLATTSWHAADRPYAGVSVIVGWGYNNYGQLNVPANLGGVVAIAAGAYHGLALKSDGTVIGWGTNNAGQLSIPADLKGVSTIAATQSGSFALKVDGTVVGWGSNSVGETTIPAGLNGVRAIAAGPYSAAFVLALKNDGTIVGWGSNGAVRIGLPGDLTGVAAIAAGNDHALALKNDGTVVAWGNNSYGQISVPAGLVGVTAISAGQYHCLALKSDGTVVAWGLNQHGQATVPVGLNGVVAIAAAAYHSLALKSDGTVVAWGYNGNGQATVPEGLRGVIKIAGAANHSLVLKSEVP